jgi:alpha-tubulin suppressor-like RCC1 family protein
MLFSWGSEKDGVLGIGKAVNPQFFPTKVVMDENNEALDILEISAGKNHVGVVCKRRNDEDGNVLFMWGSNNYG